MNSQEVSLWRKTRRADLIDARLAMPTRLRDQYTALLITHLAPLIADLMQPISAYWPLKGEPDLRPLMRELDRAEVLMALPVALRLGEPMSFRPWHHGATMERGIWGIPIPATHDEVQPRIVLAPLVGFDNAGYRLGYGGGFFDRTLSAISPLPLIIGIAYASAKLATVHPQPHDVPMDFIVNEEGIFRSVNGNLQRLDIAEARRVAVNVAEARGTLRQSTFSLPDGGSPPCSAQEFPRYFDAAISNDELAMLLNTLLEAERAGAKVISTILADYTDTLARETLRAVHRDEVRNCGLLIDALRALGRTPSNSTGDFVEKALAIEGRAARLDFLNRGQAWVAKKIGAVHPRLAPGPIGDMLTEMQSSHLVNIQLCERVVASLTKS